MSYGEQEPLEEVIYQTGMARAELMVSELDLLVSEDLMSEILTWCVLLTMLSLTVWSIVTFDTCPEWACDFNGSDPTPHKYFVEFPLYPVRLIACSFPSMANTIVCGASVTTPLVCSLILFRKILNNLASFEGYGQPPPDHGKKNR